MTALRGSTGAAPFPPRDLHTRNIPMTLVAAGAPLFRVHRSRLGPIFFGPGKDAPPTYRLDPESGRFGVLYVSPGPDAAIIETLLRNPRRLGVDYRDIASRSLAVLSCARDLNLVDARGANLSQLGTTAALSTGPYEPCAAWADSLFDHPRRPDGIMYMSRHNPDEPCIAVFERSDIVLSVARTTALTLIPERVGAVLDRHGKSLLGAPPSF